MADGWGGQEWGNAPWGAGSGTFAVDTALHVGVGLHRSKNWGSYEPTPGSSLYPVYRLVLADLGTSGLGTPIVTNVLASGIPGDAEFACRWSKTLNAAGTIEFTLPADGDGVTEAVYAPGQRELHLYRDMQSESGGEELVWAGRLWVADVRWPWVRFLGMGHYETLRHRELGDDFYRSSVEQLNIAWELIDYTQTQTGGDLGISRDSLLASGVTRTVLHCAEERRVIADCIEDLAGADDGFDFEITPDKAWKTYTPQRGTDLSALIELDAASTIADMTYTIDATSVENEVASIGKLGDCEPIQYDTYVDTASRTAYGLLQGTIERSDINQDRPLLRALARERLALMSEARKQPQVRCMIDLGGPSPLTGDFDLGDVITVTASRGFATFSDPFRVMGYTVTFDAIGREVVDLELDAVVD